MVVVVVAAFYGQLVKGCRNQGGQKKRFNDSFKYNLKKCSNVNTETWEVTAKDKSSLHASIRKDTTQFETDHIA